jgi:hypothetical protein
MCLKIQSLKACRISQALPFGNVGSLSDFYSFVGKQEWLEKIFAAVEVGADFLNENDRS